MNSEPALLWVVLAWTGLGIAVIGWTDLVLLWYPLQFGNPEWEFGTISAFLDGLPLGTVGLSLFAAGAIGRSWRRTTRGVGIACLVLALVILAISIVYLLDVPLAWRSAPPPLKPTMAKAMLKAGVFAATYTALFGWLGWFLWRATRLDRL